MVARILLAIVGCSFASGCTQLRRPEHEMVQVTVDSICDPAAVAESERLLRRAQKQLDHGRIDAAEQTLLDTLDLNPDLGPAHNNLGLIYYQRRDLYDAARAFDQAAMLMPESGLPHNNLGLVLETGGRLDAAIEQYEMAYSIEPQTSEFLGNLARAKLAQGDFSDEVVYLLEELVFLEKRPDWLEWAQDELQLMIPAARHAAMTESETSRRDIDDEKASVDESERSLSPPENLPPPVGKIQQHQ